MVFPVVMYKRDSWTTKKAEQQRIDAFEMWCWRRLLRVPWIASSSNQSILWPSDVKSQLIGKDPDSGKNWGQEEKCGWQRMRRLDGIINSMDMSLCKLWKIVKDREVWRDAVHGVAKSWTQLSHWTIIKPNRPARVKQSWLVFSCYCWQTLVARFFFTELH